MGEHGEGFKVLAELALTVILFNQASLLDARALVGERRVPLRLLGIGIPASIVPGTIAAVVVLRGLPLWEAVCLAVIVAPTEAALIDALLDNGRIPVPVRLALSVESGCNDGFALAGLLAAMAFASAQNEHAAGRWVWFAFRAEFVSVAVGTVVGLVGATVISRSSARGWMTDTWAQLATLALALMCFEFGERLHASGFVTAFAAGLAYAMVSPRSSVKPTTTQVSDAADQLLELLVFAVFGGFAVIPAWRDIGWRVVAFAVVAVILVRVAAVAIALLGSGLSLSDTLFIGWFGPRGIGSVVLGLLVIEQGEIHQGALIRQTVVVIVTASLVIHSLTAPVGIRLRELHDTPTGTPAG